MRVLVCGGRDFTDQDLIYRTLDKLHRLNIIDTLIEGDARGVDRIAGQWAKRNKVDLRIFPAEWDKYGKSAGYKRNLKMLIEGKPDLVVAFPGGKGTAMMIQIATDHGVLVEHINDKKDEV